MGIHDYDIAIKVTAKYLGVSRVLVSGISLVKPENAAFIQACIFERLCDGLQSANALMKLAKKGMDVENSLGLILRCACVDMLTVLYVTSIKDEKELFRETSRVLFGNISRDKKYIHFLINENILPKEFKDNKEMGAYEKEFAQKFGGKLEDVSTAEIHKKLRNSGFKQVTKIYDYFIYYSKYEHFSKTTYEMQRMDKKYRIGYTIEILDNIFFCLKLISVNGMFSSLPHLNVYINKFNRLPFISTSAKTANIKPDKPSAYE